MRSPETLYVILVHLMDDSGHTRVTQDEKNLLSNLIMSHSLLQSSLFAVTYTFQNEFLLFHQSVCAFINFTFLFPEKKCSDTSLLCQLKPSLMSPTQFLLFLGNLLPFTRPDFWHPLVYCSCCSQFQVFPWLQQFFYFWMWFWMSSIHTMISQHFKISKK